METKSNQNTILRVTKNTNFTTISNFHLKDINLSWGAKGLLTYLLTLPNDWKIYLSELTNHSIDGYTKTNNYIKELIKFNYIQREKIRAKTGKFGGYEYIVSEIPMIKNESSNFNRKRKTENGKTVNGKTENGKSTTTKYLYKLNTNKLITNNNNKAIEEIYKRIKKLGSIKIETLYKLIEKYGINKIDYYLTNLNRFNYSKNPIGFLLKAIENDYKIPENLIMNKPIQSYNFNQREYDEEFFDNIYENL